MAQLLTAERVGELVGMPKRVLRAAEFAWRPLAPPEGRPPPFGGIVRHHRILRVRLLAVAGREAFEIVATSNDKFSFHLRWQDIVLARLCCSSYHAIPAKLGGGKVRGPHVHYHRPGFGDAYAEATSRFNHQDVNGAMSFFLELCGVQNPPAIQEMLELR